MRSADDYTSQLQALLPPGRAWPRDPDSWLSRMLSALALEFARVDGRALGLLDEADPQTALELLPDWERVAGLPDPCIPVPIVIRERQIAVTQKIAGLGGQTPQFFIDLSARVGLRAEVEEFAPFAAGDLAGAELCSEAWRHAFGLRFFGAATPDEFGLEMTEFRAGSVAGERLRTWGSSNIECLASRARPAHSSVLFFYEIEPEPALWFDFTLQ